MKILSVFGTRPEAIKMAMLARKLANTRGVDHKLCITAQHRQMLDQVMDFFDIKADYDLNLMKPGQDLTDITSRVLYGMKAIFQEEFKPDLVLVHGDTTTCLATSLAAFYAGVDVGHVEAGLRTGNILSPFPEEANRVLTGRLAKWHFAPTKRNVNHLLAEGVRSESIIETGNTVLDALLFAKEKVSDFSSEVKSQKIRSLFSSGAKILLVTGHRRENFGAGFLEICDALKELATTFSDLHIVYPVHLNPNVQKPVFEILEGISNVYLTEPLSYPDFVYAMKKSWAILTDSGGVQEEAPSLGKPVLVMRDTTERPEALEAGTVKLVGANKENIIVGLTELISSPLLYQKMSQAHNPYGDGRATDRIVDFLVKKASL
jgi:UDP-N-acetylglucosamine 2-epimerase (non-hydrolysing)